MLNRQNVGTLVADEPSAVDARQLTLETIHDLLNLVPKRSDQRGPAIHSAAATFLKFVEVAAENAPIHLLETEMERFTQDMRDRRYKYETVKSYRYCLTFLMKTAREHGWTASAMVMPPAWSQVFELAPSKAVKSIIRFAISIGKMPSTFTEEDLRTWSQKQVQIGLSLGTCRERISSFRSLLSKPEFVHLQPILKAQPKGYGVSLRKMHPSLRSELEALMVYLTDRFHLDRDGPPIREVTAQSLLGFFVRLTGFVQNIRNLAPVESFASLLTRENVGAFVTWGVQERKLQAGGFLRDLSKVRSAFKSHPDYLALDLSWLPSLIKKLPKTDQREIDDRKGPKLISYDAAEAIPVRIRESRNRAKNLSASDLAISLRNELLMSWLVILPWRQRNLRECRISGGDHKNLFLGSIQKHSSQTKPKWLEAQGTLDGNEQIWQIYFLKDETKSKNTVSAILPAELAKLLDEYLTHRGALVPADRPDPGTLFLTVKGKAFNDHNIRDVIKELASRHAGVAVNPHLFRDIVAHEWLQKHPDDYLTISKILWHKTLEYTLKVYCSRFNESTGIARMDDWRASRVKSA